MLQELKKELNDPNGSRIITLHGKLHLNIDRSGGFTIGKNAIQGILRIRRSNIIIDGSDAELYVDISNCEGSDHALFLVENAARNVVFRNISLQVHIQNEHHCTRSFHVIRNTGFGTRIENCNIRLYSERQLNLIGISNDGNLYTHLTTPADNFSITDSTVRVECVPTEFPENCTVFGVHNRLANSISVQNCFIYATIRGNSEKQKAIGLYTNGRFGRYVGNNIKANACHNVGKRKEQAHAIGFENNGPYSILTSNNIVGEWGGRCVGLYNSKEALYANVTANKILSTHTICGRSVEHRADNCIISSNILTSTSRNARLLDLHASYCTINGNYMEALLSTHICPSGCGIYAPERSAGNIITHNTIRNPASCGMYLDDNDGIINENSIQTSGLSCIAPKNTSPSLRFKLDEKSICSVE